MRVAIFSDTYPPFINGVSTSTYNLATTLKEHGNEVLVVTPLARDGEMEYKDGVLYVPGLEMKKIYGYRSTSIYSTKAMSIIRDFDPEIIHNQTDYTIGVFAKIVARMLSIPIIYTYHTAIEDYSYYITHGFLDRIAKKIVRTYSNNVARSSTEYITPSIKIKEFTRAVGNDIYINVIPTGIDFSLFKANQIDPAKIKEFKEKYNIGDNTKIFLILGRIAREKSMDVSLKCFAYYHEKHPEVDKKFVVVGGGPQLEEYQELAKSLGIGDYTIFIGPVPSSEVPFYYNIADIYTSASLTETQGLTFMEAMASETIVIARYDDNLSGTIIDNKTGFFFTDEESFTEKVEKIFSLNEEELTEIKKAAIDVCNIYSIEKFYQNIMEVYKRAKRKYW